MSHPHPDVPFATDLADHADRTALVTSGGALSYRELAARVAATARRLGTRRRLILLAGANTVDTVVLYLAALAAGHPVLLAPHDRPDAVRSLIDAYDPDVVGFPDGVLDERRDVSAHALHPDLALLLSTSGTTGSPKLVRLSHENLRANAASIAGYLGIHADDRAATTLPMHYCYGLSVINSHLLRGAALILTDLSVTDARFWELFREARGTTFAGVPYTFDLLDRVGFADMRLPHLRYVTQAGGRLAPDRVRRYAELGRRRGWDLVVMYGQTEATARMAYLPPELAASRPGTIGVPIPGGSFRLEPVPDRPGAGVGELVYSGPNVMLGYAESPSDLALGRTVGELRTGDLARLTPDGLYEVVGRRGRFVKLYGLRIDPRAVEESLARNGLTAYCAGDDEALVVAVTGGADAGRVRRLVADGCGLPGRAVRVHAVAEPPRLPSGKPDYRAIACLGRPEAVSGTDLVRLYAEMLDRSDVTEECSFVSLGGDSLSYVEMSLRLEETLGSLPADWHTRPIRDLRPVRDLRGPAERSRWRTLETGIALRAAAIVLIVGSHISLFTIRGGAHVLLAVAGFNFARFHLTAAGRRERRHHVLTALARIAVPSVAWIAAAGLLTADYHLGDALLLDSALGRNSNYWFVEVIVYILLAMAVWLSVPGLDRAERRAPYGFALGILALGVAARFDFLGLLDLPSALAAFWMFPLGWAAAKATNPGQRLLVTAIALATVPGYFGPGELTREILIIGGVALLVWVPALPSTAWLNRLAGLLAGASLYIYLAHWQIYPLLADRSQPLALLASLAGGAAYAAVATRALRYATPRQSLGPSPARPAELTPAPGTR
ncbi:AMP-binding protein [Actinomadura viridis]|uniref:Acyl-CoA synthetase (AMP-forming)/AMP-acid ligase II n=1 Tax=Actinomadura viridis TaxID=58110 RepID=A0A931GRK8_9ACTN|nr:AMP-binding protein [Actinomadura viridis]MBG6092961.1 acyl-CoA synthetase (AMP-forming)/AMP-acid ligase II [Actinomadura viridis]